MSDNDYTNAPTPGSSRHVTTTLPPGPHVADWLNIAVRRPNPRSAIRLCLRVASTAAVAAAFVYLCWLMCHNADPNIQILSGPVWLLRWSDTDKSSAVATIAVLVLCIFAVGVRVNAVTFFMSVLGCVAWLVVGLYVVGMSV